MPARTLSSDEVSFEMDDTLSILNPLPTRLGGPELLHELISGANTAGVALEYVDADGEKTELSYCELHRKSELLGIRLAELRQRIYEKAPGIIPIYIPQCPSLYISQLAILKSGAAFCPLNLDVPEDRLRFILKDTSAKFLLTTTSMRPKLPDLKDVHILTVDDGSLDNDAGDFAANHMQDEMMHSGSASLAYVMYTSGSTGLPKAVCLSHLAVTQSLLAHNRFIPRFSRFLQFASPTFDVSVFEIFFPWYRGSTLVSVERGRLLSDLPGTVTALEIDAAELTPSVAASLIRTRDNVPTLRLLLTIGEMLNAQVIKQFGGSDTRPGILYGMYGPTEAAIHCTLQPRFSADLPAGTIGIPLETVSCFVIKPADSAENAGSIEILPIGEIGELAVGGQQLADGYLNREEQTRAAFIKHSKFGNLYRTGDKARLLSNGTLECHGRISSGQVKLRGQRVELGEIEHAASKVAGCHAVVASVISGLLVVFCIVDLANVSTVDIKNACRKWLPQYMVPSDVVLLEDFPYLPSGKVDKRKLEGDYSSRSTESITQTHDVSEDVRIFMRVLQDALHTPIEPSTDLGAAGLDSLRAIQIASELCKQGYTGIGALDLLNAATVLEVDENRQIRSPGSVTGGTQDAEWAEMTKELRESVERDLGHGASRIDLQEVLPCTPLQDAMLTETAKHPKAYCNSLKLTLPGDFEFEQIHCALTALSDKHTSLRSGFCTSGVDHCSYAQIVWQNLDPSQITAVDAWEDEFLIAANSTLLRPLRIQLKRTDGESELLIQIHHALYDQWSIEIVLEDLGALLHGCKIPDRPSFSVVNQFYSQKKLEDQASHVSFWQEYLSGASSGRLPNLCAKVSPAQALQTIEHTIELDVGDLRKAAKSHSCSPHVFFQSAYAFLLGMYMGNDDVVFGTVFSGRTLPLPGIENIVGPILSTLPSRVDLSGGRKFSDILRRLQSDNREIMQNGMSSLADIQKACGAMPGERLFDSIFVWQETARTTSQTSGLVKLKESRDYLEFNLTLELEPFEDGIKAKATYQPSLIPPQQTKVLLQQLGELVKSVVATPHSSMNELSSCLSDSALSIANPEPRNFEYHAGLGSIIERHALQTPDKLALVFAQDLSQDTSSTEALSYHDLNVRANKLAHHLISRGAEPDSLVCVCMTKSINLYVAILAVVKAGCGYLPLVPETPSARITQILDDANIQICLTDATTTDTISRMEVCSVIDTSDVDLSNKSVANPRVAFDPKNIAYAVFTSGTTGQPKGVLVTQENILSNLEVLRDIYPVPDNSRLLQACNQAFDVSVFEIFFTWYSGMCLCSAPKDILFRDFEHTINTLGITHLSLTPTVASLVDPANIPGVSFLVTAGEAVTHQVHQAWAGRGLYQGYGPSETTNICTVNPAVGSDHAINNIGPPFENTSAFVLSRGSDFQILPIGSLGELCFGGQQVFRGYQNMPELTQSKIIEHSKYGRIYRSGDLGRMLPDGTILIQGRTDDQRKIRGQRVELGEIIGCLLQVSGVRDCAVDIVNKGDQDRLMAFWVPQHCRSEVYSILPSDEVIQNTIDTAFKHLADHLPVYMTPDSLIPVTAIPMTSQGKIDRRRLVADGSKLDTEVLNTFSQAFDAEDDTNELSEIEKQLVQALAETLYVPSTSINRSTSFYALGLDSVSAIRFSTKLRTVYDFHIEVSQILKRPSIAGLASKLQEQQPHSQVEKHHSGMGACETVVRANLYDKIAMQFHQHGRTVKQILPCTPLQEAMLSAEKVSTEPSAYRNKTLFGLQGDAEKLKRCWELMIQRHEILRTAFVETENSKLPYVQVIMSDAILPWNVYDSDISDPKVLLDSNSGPNISPLGYASPWQIQVHNADAELYLLLDMHHALYDANALSTLLHEVEETYNGSTLPSAVSFVPFLDYMLSADTKQADDYFSKQLHNFIPRPFRKSASNTTNLAFGTISGHISCSSEVVDTFLKRHSLAMLDLVQAMWAKALSVSQCHTDVCFGNVVSGRSVPVEGVDALVAPCFNTVPVRIDLSKHRNNLSLVKALHKSNVDVLPFQLTPLRRIHKHNTTAGRRLFDSLVLLQQQSSDLDPVIWKFEGESGDMDFPCIVELTPDHGSFNLSLHFDRGLLDNEAVRKLHEACLSAFVSCARYPSSDVFDFVDFDSETVSGALKPDEEYMQSIETAHKLQSATHGNSMDGPWSPLELQIRAAYSAISSTPEERIRKGTTIYRIGLDSISAIQVASRLRKEGFNLQASDVMESPSCSELASVIQSRAQTPARTTPTFDFETFDKSHRAATLHSCGISSNEISSIRPCTAVQSGMLGQNLRSGGQEYFNHTFYKLERHPGRKNLQNAWSQVIKQHEMLRTGFVATEDHKNPFVMLTYKQPDSDLFSLDTRSEATNVDFSSCKELAFRSVEGKIHLPPWRWSLAEINGEVCLQFSAHHALFDAESLRLIMSDLQTALTGDNVSARQGIDGALSYIISKSQADPQEQKTFWSQQLEGAPVTRFPNMAPIRNQSQGPTVISSTFGLPRSQLEGRCQEAGISMQSVGQAAWARILSAYTGEAQVTFGVVFSGRSAPETAASPFPCITTLPVCSDASMKDSELLSSLMSYNAGIQKFQFTPLTDIQRYAELPNEALFDSLFAYQRPLSNELSHSSWQVVHEEASVELAVSIEMEALPSDRLGFRLTVDPAQVPIPQGEIMLHQMEEIILNLIGIKEAFDESALSIIAPKDPVIPTNFRYLHEFAEACVESFPDRIAMEFVDSLSDGKVFSRSWTYRQLDEQANRIAHLLMRRGLKPGDIVATSFDKCPEASFAFFGILKAGCAFCAIDPTAPTARKVFILEDSASKVMLTTSSIQSELGRSGNCDIIDLINLDEGEPLPTHPVSLSKLSSSSVSYVLYTSGTTGTPKGCEITHENAVQALMSFQRLFKGRWTDDSRWLQFASYHFDVSVLEQFWTWGVGMRLVCAPRDLILEDIMGFLDTMHITHLDLTPSLGRLLDPAMVPSLHNGVFITGGEALKQDMIGTWGDIGCLFNFYGPTECTIGVTVFPSVPQEGKPSNIGWQFDNVGSYVLAPGSHEPVLRGAIGELCISGKLVGKGYLNRKELTEERFPVLKNYGERVYRTGDLVRVFHDGSFDFMGRQDHQVKLRGQRLEIDEIEAVIRRCPEIQDTVCLVAQHPKQQKDQLIGFIGVSSKRKQGKPEACPVESTRNLIQIARKACEDHLPGYMIPTHFLPIKHVPLSVNNKVEEKLLRQLYANIPTTDIQSYAVSSESQQTLNGEERKVAGVLADLLKIEVTDLKPSSNIFTLGLNSISAIQFSKKLRAGGYANAQVAVILRNSTIGGITKEIVARGTQTHGEVAEAIQTISACRHRHLSTVTRVLRCKMDDIETVAPCTPLQQGIISRSLASESALYFNTFRYSAEGLDPLKLEEAFREALAQSQVLRTFFVETDDGYVQAVKKTGHLPWWTLEVYDHASMEKVLASRKDKWRSYNTSHLTVPFEVVIVRFESEMVWEVHMHHALYDGNSFDLLMNNVFRLYNSQDAGFGKAFIDCLPYGPLRKVQGAREFWTNHLAELETAFMPSLINKTVDKDTLYTSTLHIGEKAGELRRTLGVTLQALVQASWLVTLRKYYLGAVGTVVSGRSIDFDGVEEVIGPLFNTIPFYPRCEASDSWHSFIQRCHDFNTAALPYQHTALRDIVKWCKKGKSEPLFDTLFVFQSFLEDSDKTASFTSVDDGRFEADYPLSFEAEETADGSVRITVAAKSSVCDLTKAKELIEEFTLAFEAMAQNPEGSISLEDGQTFVHTTKSADKTRADHQIDGSHAFQWTQDAETIRSEVASLAAINDNEINEHTSIFEIGLDSVDAVKLSARLRKKGVMLAVSAIMRSQTISKMSAFVSKTSLDTSKVESEDTYQKLQNKLTAYSRHHIEDYNAIESILPASPMQEALVSEMIRSSYRAYFNHDVLRISSQISIEKLEDAWREVVEASPVLRTGFIEIEDPDLDVTFAQVVHKARSFDLERTDLPSIEDVANHLERINAVVSSTSLQRPQLRLTLVTISDESYLILSIAHALYDGHSLSLLHEDISRSYNNTYKPRPFYSEVLKDLIQLSDSGAADFWTNLLSGAKKTHLPQILDSKTKTTITHRAEKTSRLSSTDLASFCKRQGVTLQAACQTAWACVLSHVVQALDVMFGVVLAGRDSELAEDVMFPMMNTVTMRSILHGSRKDVLQSIQATIADISNHQHFPLRQTQAICQRVVQASTTGSRGDAFFDALFTFQRRPNSQDTEAMSLYESVTGASDVEYPIAVEAEVVNDSLVWRIACKSSYFDADRAGGLLDMIEHVLQETVAQPDAPTLSFHDQSVSICGLPAFQQQAEVGAEEASDSTEVSNEVTDSWTDLELTIRDIIVRVTKTPEDEISKSAPIQNLGVDSINAIKISALLRQKRFKVSVSEIIRAGSIVKIAASVSQSRPEETTVSARSGKQDIARYLAQNKIKAEQLGYDVQDVEEILPATAGQMYMLGAWQATRGQIFFPEFEYRTTFPTTVAAIKQAWEKLVSTNAILRTVFVATRHTDTPIVQLVLRNSSAAFIDLGYSEEATEVRQPFARLSAEQAGEGCRLRLKIHHALYDAASLPMLMQTLGSYATGSPTLSESSITFAEYIAPSLNEESVSTRKAFWVSYLRDIGTSQTNVDSFPSARHVEAYDPRALAMTSTLEASLRKQGVNIQALFFAAYARAYSFHAEIDTEDVIIGIYLANRSHVEELSTLAAPTLNLVPLRVRSPVSTSLTQLAKQIQEDLQTIGSHENSSVSLWEIEAWTGVKVHTFVNFVKALGGSDEDDKSTPESIVMDEGAEDRRVEKRSRVTESTAEGFSVPEELRQSKMSDVYPRALDIEATVADGALGIGVFGWEDMMDAEQAEGLIQELKIEIEGVLES